MRLNVIDRPKEPPRRRFRLSQVLIGLCAAVAMTAVGGVAITLTAIESRHTPHQAPIVPTVAPLPTSPDAKLPVAIPSSPPAPSPLPPPPSEVPAPSAAAPSSVSIPPPPPPEPPAATTADDDDDQTGAGHHDAAADHRADHDAADHRTTEHHRAAERGGVAGYLGVALGADDHPVAARPADTGPDTDSGAGKPGPAKPGPAKPGAAGSGPAEPVSESRAAPKPSTSGVAVSFELDEKSFLPRCARVGFKLANCIQAS